MPAGLFALDALVKAAHVNVRFAGDVDPGRWLIVIDGELGEVEVALEKGIEAGADDLLETLLLPAAHGALRAALRGDLTPPEPLAAAEATLGALECHTLIATLAATDRALKAAQVHLLRLRLATHLNGAGHAVLAGDHADVLAALQAAQAGAAANVEVRVRAIPRAAGETAAAAAQRPGRGRSLRPLEG